MILEELGTVEAMVNIALNTKPKNRKRTKETREETMCIIAGMIKEIQNKIIAYECLRTVVSRSKDSKEIIEQAEIITAIALGNLKAKK